MDWLKSFLSIFILLMSATACSAGEEPAVEFQIKKIKVSNQSLKVAIADDDVKRARGMMFVEKFDAYQGMLFIFEKAQIRSFWMKNTLLPLSLGFYDAQKSLIETVDLNPPLSIAQIKVEKAVSSKPAKYVLEVPQGWFKKHGVLKGSQIKEI